MPAAGNFTTVTLGPDDTGTEKLKVNGVSDEPDRVNAIYVAVAHAGAQHSLTAGEDTGDEPHNLPSTAVVMPAGASGWTAFLEQGDPPYELGETVLAVGVMIDGKDGSPSFWHRTLTIESET
jgi:hypothetical protein